MGKGDGEDVQERKKETRREEKNRGPEREGTLSGTTRREVPIAWTGRGEGRMEGEEKRREREMKGRGGKW